MAEQTIRQSYDEVPYPTVPRVQTHPNHLAALGKLYGLEPAPVERCRVLDIGCADGSNIIPMAYQLPNSEFVGLDFSANQIAVGQQRIEALGLKNITLKTQDILDFGPDWGKFDYIIAYGVYSWVPPAVQEKVLEICQRHLSAQGVAYISYNVYPGWHMHGLVRGMMLYHTRNLDNPSERAKMSRSMLDFYVETVPKLSSKLPAALQASSTIFESLRDILQKQPDEYLLHDQLESINKPLHLYEFVARAEQHGLQYLTDAESSALSKNYLPAQFVESIRDIAQTEVELEQLMDFLYMRAFRQTLLCHQNVPLRRDVSPERLRGLLVASPVRPVDEDLDLTSNEEAVFRGPIGTTLKTSQPLNKMALDYLAEIWPQPVAFDKLLSIARARLNPDATVVYSAANVARDVEMLGTTLLRGYALNLIELHSYAPNFTLEAGDYPTVSDLVRFQTQAEMYLTNQRHEIVNLEDEISRYLLPFMDGHHDDSALIDKLIELVDDGALIVQPDGEPLRDRAQLRTILADVLTRSLIKLGRDALLVK